MEKKLLHEVRSQLEFMSDVERSVADMIIKNPKRFIVLSLGEVASEAGVSQGSVVNFAKKYGDCGFAALKLKIAACLSDEKKPFSTLKITDSAVDALKKTVADTYTALSNTAAINSEKTLRTVAERILHAKKVEIYGIYRSGVVANDFYYQLLQLGIPAAYVSDVLTCSVSASLLGEGSLVIAVSSSGQTQDVIDAVRLAKENGVPVVALTAHRSSPLAALADEVLIAAPSGSSISASGTEIRHSQLALTEAICSYIAQKLGKSGEEKYFKASKILSTHNVKE